jgi:hypothetical protein
MRGTADPEKSGAGPGERAVQQCGVLTSAVCLLTPPLQGVGSSRRATVVSVGQQDFVEVGRDGHLVVLEVP